MASLKAGYEEFKVRGQDLVEKMRGFIHEGNIRRIIIKDDKGNTFMEIPLSVATVGTLFMPLLAAFGTIAALVNDFTIVVERTVEDKPDAHAGKPPEDTPVAPIS